MVDSMSKKNKITQKEQFDTVISAIHGKETLSSKSNNISVTDQLDLNSKAFAKMDKVADSNRAKSDPNPVVFSEMSRYSIERSFDKATTLKGKNVKGISKVAKLDKPADSA